ncbi:unnamed protein product [Lactuca virosa]|uniref:Uncharacterized protein n=1 Tax=Lactuca virosa TaxID=75947 RepID=A0AAU9NVX1_9ASTR|nr:unnamed protein product [Lactuca virosa]
MHSKSTIGVEFQTQTMEIDGKEVKSLDLGHCRTTFDSVTRWIKELKNLTETATHSDTTSVRMLVRNKCDLGNIQAESVEDGKKLAENEGLIFMETSALDSTNVKTTFELVIKEIYNNVSRKVVNFESYKSFLFLRCL